MPQDNKANANKIPYVTAKCIALVITRTDYDANCYQCNTGYVKEGTKCKPSKTLSTELCRIQTSATVCKVCQDGQYFRGTSCKAAKLVGFALILLAALFFN